MYVSLFSLKPMTMKIFSDNIDNRMDAKFISRLITLKKIPDTGIDTAAIFTLSIHSLRLKRAESPRSICSRILLKSLPRSNYDMSYHSYKNFNNLL